MNGPTFCGLPYFNTKSGVVLYTWWRNKGQCLLVSGTGEIVETLRMIIKEEFLNMKV